jgi:4-amino-4-deoxy-L-arabinose transferase-like glycosyltransferase
MNLLQTPAENIVPTKREGVWGPAAAGLILLLLYAVVAALRDDFVISDFVYARDGTIPTRYFPEQDLLSMLWKFVFLLPAAVLLATACTRSGLRLRFVPQGRETTALWVLLIGAALVLVVSTQALFHETEVTDDENVYDFQARTLLLGRVVNPPAPVPESFANAFIINTMSQRTGKYTLGHPAVIALGLALGNRYVGIIALSVLSILLLSRIAFELYGDRRLAILSAILACSSPFFYLASSSRLSHTTSAFFLALFMYLFLCSRRDRPPVSGTILAFLAGLALGYAFNTRSLTAIGFAVPFGALIGADLWRRRKGIWPRTLALVAGFGIVLLVTLRLNRIVTGDALLFPFLFYNPAEQMGFGAAGHTLWGGFRNLSVSTVRMNVFLFGLPASLIFLVPIVIGKKNVADRLLLGIIACFCVAYFFYYSPGVADLGPVYYYELIIPLVILSARGIVAAHGFIVTKGLAGDGWMPNFVVISFILALATFFPERAMHVSRLTRHIREPYESVQAAGIHHALVMIVSPPHQGWVFGYRSGSPLFDDDVVYCKYADRASNVAIADFFKGRDLYLLGFAEKTDSTVIGKVQREDILALPGLRPPRPAP